MQEHGQHANEEPDGPVTTNGIVLRDEDGVPRIRMYASKRVSFISIEGDDRAELVLEVVGSDLRIRMRTRGGGDAALVAASGRAVSLVLFDDENRGRMHVGCDLSTMTGNLSVRDEKGRVVRNSDL